MSRSDEETVFVAGEDFDEENLHSIKKTGKDFTVTLNSSSADESGGRHCTFEFCCLKTGKVLKFGGYFLAAAYAGIVSIIFAGLTAERNKNNSEAAWEGAAESFLLNAPMSFTFAIDTPGFFMKIWELDRYYRVAAAAGLILGLANMGAGLQIGKEAVLDNASPIVNIFGWAGVVTYEFNTLSTRMIGGTGFVYAAISEIVKRVKREYETYKNLFNFVDDLNTYGYLLEKSDFHFEIPKDDKSGTLPSIGILAQRFYDALNGHNKDGKLAKQRIKPRAKTTQAFYQVYKFSLTTLLLLANYPFMRMFMWATQRGWDAFNPAYALGTNSAAMTWIGAIGAELFYMNTARLLPDTLWEMASMPVQSQSHTSRSFGMKTLITAPLVLTTWGVLGYAGWNSGAGMALQQMLAYNASYGSIANSTFVNTPLNWPTIPVEWAVGNFAALTGAAFSAGLVGLQQFGAGVQANSGSVWRYFRSYFFTGNSSGFLSSTDGGVIDLLRRVEKIATYRQWDKLHADDLDMIGRARETWDPKDFSWKDLYRASKTKVSAMFQCCRNNTDEIKIGNGATTEEENENERLLNLNMN